MFFEGMRKSVLETENVVLWKEILKVKYQL